MTIANLLLALHLLCAVIWVGGMAFALLVLRPSLHVLAAPDRLALHVEVFRRFFKIVWHAMPVLVLSGDAMVFYIFGGFRGVGWPVHAMHTSGAIMAVIFVYIFFRPWFAMLRAMKARDQAAALLALSQIRQWITINLGLGVLTIVFAALG